MKRPGILLIVALALAQRADAQAIFTPGELVVTGYRETVDSGFREFTSNIHVYGEDGVFRRELATSSSRRFSEPLVRDALVFVSGHFWNAIERIDADGNILSPFTTAVNAINYLSPGPQGGVLAANTSGEISQFSAGGALLFYRDITHTPRAFGGIDLAADGCTVIFGTLSGVARWNACLNTPAELFAPLGASDIEGLRVLPDGSILVSVLRGDRRILHLDSSGNILREHPIPGLHIALALDARSFWTNAGNHLLRIDIASGTILSETFTEYQIFGISVVGEPRAGAVAPATVPIPMASHVGMVVIGLTLAVVALVRLR